MTHRSPRRRTAFLVLGCFLLAISASPAQAQSVAPHIDVLDDSSPAPSGRLVIAGSGFGAERGSVTIDGLEAIVTTWNDTEIHAYVPESVAPGATSVQVIAAAGASNPVDIAVTARAADGRVRWRFRLDSPYPGRHIGVGPDGTVYATDQRRLYALSPDGGLKWVLDGAGGGRPITFADDGTIYSGAGTVQAVNPDGTLAWRFTPAGIPDMVAGPGVGPFGGIYGAANGLSGGIGAFALDSAGGEDWSDPGEPAIVSFPGSNSEIVFDGADSERFYFGVAADGSSPPVLWAYDLSGKQLWSRGTGCESFPRSAPAGGIVVAGDGGCGVTALDRDGKVRWNAQPPQSVGELVRPAVGPDGAIYTADFFGQDFWAIDPDGGTRWFIADGHGMMANLGVSPDNAVVVDGGRAGFGMPGWMRGYATADGSLRWQVDLPRENGLDMVTWSVRPGFAADSRTAFATTGFLGSAEYSYLYAVDVSGGGQAPAPTNQAPTASFLATPTSGAAPLPVGFDASTSSDADGFVEFFDWNFGDGSVGGGVTAGHTYTVAGTYTATLTVTDDDGLTHSASITVTVSGDGGSGSIDEIAVSRAQCSSRKGALRLSASSSDGAARLTTTIGGVSYAVKNGGETRISLASCPSTVTIDSSSGGQVTASVKVK